MSSGLGRFNDRKIKQRYLQSKADEINKEKGYLSPDYYDTFDNFDPVIVKKEKKPLIDETQLVDKLPFEKDGKLENPYGPLNVGLTHSHNIPSNTHRRFKEMDKFYESQRMTDGGENLQTQLLRESKENDKKMKHEIHRDHLAEMFGGANFSKEPIKSEFKDNFGKLFSPQCTQTTWNMRTSTRMFLTTTRKTK